MDPANSKDYFQTRDRRLGPRSIRLLQCCHYNPDTYEIIGTLETFLIDECPAYYALSYTWGSAVENDINTEIAETHLPACTLKILDGDQVKYSDWSQESAEPLKTGENLSDFLLHLNDCRFRGERYPPSDTRLWIDAISINQSDPIEIASQVMLMGDIYSRADHVIVWLGSGDSDLELFTWMQEVIWPAFRPLLLNMSEETADKQLVQAWRSYFRCFTRRRWFTRAWVVQEVCLSQSISVVWGAGYFPWTDVTAFLDWIFCSWIYTIKLLGSSLYEIEVGGKNMVELCRFRTEYQKLIETDANITNPPYAVDPSTIDRWKSTSDVYTWATTLTLRNSLSLGFLSAVEHRGQRKTNETPSWVPDLAVMPQHFELDKLSILDASCVRDGHIANPVIHGKQLTLIGANIGSISSVFKLQTNDELGMAAFQLARETTTIYSPTKECRLEAVWRTLLADHDSFDERDYHPSLEFCEAFSGFIKIVLLKPKNPAATNEFDNALSVFEEMEEEILRKIKEEEKDLIMHGDEQSENPKPAWKRLPVYTSSHFTEHAILLRNRCLFRTSNGYIGMALGSVEPGDAVWLLQGGMVPYVLQKSVNNTGNDSYLFGGDCYVHGIMRGELMTEELRRSFTTIHIK